MLVQNAVHLKPLLLRNLDDQKQNLENNTKGIADLTSEQRIYLKQLSAGKVKQIEKQIYQIQKLKTSEFNDQASLVQLFLEQVDNKLSSTIQKIIEDLVAQFKELAVSKSDKYGNEETEREEWWIDDHATFDLDNIIKASNNNNNNDSSAIDLLRSSLVKSKKRVGHKVYYVDNEYEEPTLLEVDTTSRGFKLPWQYFNQDSNGPIKMYETFMKDYQKQVATLREPKVVVLADYRLIVNDFVKIELKSSDLVSEKVHVIANSANIHLVHDGGLAKVINSKGGRNQQVQKDSDAWKANHMKILPYGSCVVTKVAGQIKAHYVIHCVGPKYIAETPHDYQDDDDENDLQSIPNSVRVHKQQTIQISGVTKKFRDKFETKRQTWSHNLVEEKKSQSEQILRATVINALDAAKELGAKSIAFPAISTGTFNYPVDLCAQIMIETCVQWALVQKKYMNCYLENIKLMNIDDRNHQVFQTEFKKVVKQMQRQNMIVV